MSWTLRWLSSLLDKLDIQSYKYNIITVLSDDDDDGILSVSDEISSFGFYSDDDDDVKRHQNINNAVMTI